MHQIPTDRTKFLTQIWKDGTCNSGPFKQKLTRMNVDKKTFIVPDM